MSYANNPLTLFIFAMTIIGGLTYFFESDPRASSLAPKIYVQPDTAKSKKIATPNSSSVIKKPSPQVQQNLTRKYFPNSARVSSNTQSKNSIIMKRYQTALYRAGYNVKITGQYDRSTKRAISLWKRKNHLPQPEIPSMTAAQWNYLVNHYLR